MMAPSKVDLRFWRSFATPVLGNCHCGKWIEESSVEQEHSISLSRKKCWVLPASSLFTPSVLSSMEVADVPPKRGKITKWGNSHSD